MTPRSRTIKLEPPGRPRRRGKLLIMGPMTIPELARSRLVAVYLPPGYDHDVSRRYPVMYMWDGQNLFDPMTSFCGDWQMDLAVDELVLKGEIAPFISVGIYNGNEYRLSEQSPWSDPYYRCTGEAEFFLEWVVGPLKAEIDRRYRTLTSAAYTGIGGSSMGGLTSLYALFRYPAAFSRALVMSPSLWFARGEIFDFIASTAAKPDNSRIYLDFGKREMRTGPGTRLLRDARIMRELLISVGYRLDEDLKWVEDPSGIHSEACWASRLPGALRFLWPKEIVASVNFSADLAS
ncbi:MAG: alpha/beta hydrolase [Cyanobacteria bacterium NC_groundwater_1444_Ag_S-0.65um_54_12]|nr:alpha/beta hydrolase [Cyanobacteria bacterium NC_groundwater_1444_Ag_S-0.65um_54_12]